MFFKKSQGTVEYIIILSVIILIGLIIAVIMGWFPGSTSQITMNQSKAYWKSTLPLALDDWKLTSNGKLSLTIRNQTLYELYLTKVIVDGNSYSVSKRIPFGGKVIVEINTNKRFKENDLVSLKIGLGYKMNNLNKTFFGEKPILVDVQSASIITFVSDLPTTNTLYRTATFDKPVSGYVWLMVLADDNMNILDYGYGGASDIRFYDEYGTELDQVFLGSNDASTFDYLVYAPQSTSKIYITYGDSTLPEKNNKNLALLYLDFKDANDLSYFNGPATVSQYTYGPLYFAKVQNGNYTYLNLPINNNQDYIIDLVLVNGDDTGAKYEYTNDIRVLEPAGIGNFSNDNYNYYQLSFDSGLHQYAKKGIAYDPFNTGYINVMEDSVVNKSLRSYLEGYKFVYRKHYLGIFSGDEMVGGVVANFYHDMNVLQIYPYNNDLYIERLVVVPLTPIEYDYIISDEATIN